MEGFKHNSKYDFIYDVCIHSGISGHIGHEIKYWEKRQTQRITIPCGQIQQ